MSTAARTFGFGVYDMALRAVEDLADRDVSVRSWLAVSKWVDDAAPFPGEVFRRWVRDFYKGDKLVRGEVELRGRRVDLSIIGCAVLNVSGRRDHVVPTANTEATTSPAVRTKSQCLWTLGAWACPSRQGPTIYGPASGTGSHPLWRP